MPVKFPTGKNSPPKFSSGGKAGGDGIGDGGTVGDGERGGYEGKYGQFSPLKTNAN